MKRHNPKPSASDTEIVGEKPFEAMWAEIHAQNYTVEQPPEGALTSVEYAKKFSTQERLLSPDNARALLDRLVKQRKLETGMFRVVVEGHFRQVRHYWPKAQS